MTPRVRRIWGGTLLVIVAFSSAVASGFATYCIVASTGIGGLAPRIGPTGCEAYLTGVSALLTPTIAAIAAYIAYQQPRRRGPSCATTSTSAARGSSGGSSSPSAPCFATAASRAR